MEAAHSRTVENNLITEVGTDIIDSLVGGQFLGCRHTCPDKGFVGKVDTVAALNSHLLTGLNLLVAHDGTVLTVLVFKNYLTIVKDGHLCMERTDVLTVEYDVA